MPIADLEVGLLSLYDARPRYVEAGRYYSGDVEEEFTSQKWKRIAQRNGSSHLALNYCKTVVDTVANRMEVAGLGTVDNNDVAEELLMLLWELNEMDIYFPDIIVKTLYFGDYYLILDGDTNGVTFNPNSPLTTRVIYSDENPRIKAFAIKCWTVACPDNPRKSLVRANLYYTDHIERYISTKPDGPGEKASDFVEYTSADPTDVDSVIVHNYGFIPVYHFRTARPYGRPEHYEAYGPQREINKTAITLNAVLDAMGWPTRYFMMKDGQLSSEFDDFDSDAFHDPQNPEATTLGPDSFNQTLYPTGSALTADPGGVWALPNVAGVGQFEAADAKSFLDTIAAYVEIMAQITGTPLHYFETNANGDAPSGESLLIGDAPLQKKIKTRMTSLAATLKDCLGDALSIWDIQSMPTVSWASSALTDDLESWNLVAAKVANGVPRRQALLETGRYTPAELDSWGLTDTTSVLPADAPENTAPDSPPGDIAPAA